MEIFTLVLPDEDETAMFEELKSMAAGRPWVMVSVPDVRWVDEIGGQVLVGGAIGKDLAAAVRARRPDPAADEGPAGND